MWEGFWSAFWSNAGKLGFTHRRALVVVLAGLCAWMLVEKVPAWTAFGFVLFIYLLEPASSLLRSMIENRRVGPRVDASRQDYATYLSRQEAKLRESQPNLPLEVRADSGEANSISQDSTP